MLQRTGVKKDNTELFLFSVSDRKLYPTESSVAAQAAASVGWKCSYTLNKSAVDNPTGSNGQLQSDLRLIWSQTLLCLHSVRRGVKHQGPCCGEATASTRTESTSDSRGETRFLEAFCFVSNRRIQV